MASVWVCWVQHSGVSAGLVLGGIVNMILFRISLVRPDGGWFPGIQDIQKDIEYNIKVGRYLNTCIPKKVSLGTLSSYDKQLARGAENYVVIREGVKGLRRTQNILYNLFIKRRSDKIQLGLIIFWIIGD